MATATRPAKAQRTAGARKSAASTTRKAAKAAAGTPPPEAGSADTESRRQSPQRRGSRSSPATSAATRGETAATGRKTTRSAAGSAGANESTLLRRSSVKVPVVNMQLPMLTPRVPTVGPAVAQTKWAVQAVRANLPPADEMIYYTGLGVLTVAGALEWPVAAAVGAGVWIAGRVGARGRGRAVAA